MKYIYHCRLNEDIGNNIFTFLCGLKLKPMDIGAENINHYDFYSQFIKTYKNPNIYGSYQKEEYFSCEKCVKLLITYKIFK